MAQPSWCFETCWDTTISSAERHGYRYLNHVGQSYGFLIQMVPKRLYCDVVSMPRTADTRIQYHNASGYTNWSSSEHSVLGTYPCCACECQGLSCLD